MAGITFGSIVWAEVTDHNGNKKSRPAVIVTRNEDIKPEGPIVIKAISTQPGAGGPRIIPLHSCDADRDLTKLTKEWYAICGWYDKITHCDIVYFKLIAPPPQKRLIAHFLGADATA